MGPLASPFRPTAALLLCLALSRCTAGFLDATPPVLDHVEVRVDATIDRLPIAYLVLLDLQLPAERCDRARTVILENLHSALEARGSSVLIASFDVSQGCSQSSYRLVDVQAVIDAVRTSRANLAPKVIRPVIVYFNNINLPIPADIRDELAALPAGTAASPSFPSLLWAVLAGPTPDGLSLDAWSSWTSFDDPDLLKGLETSIEATLPFSTVVWKGLPHDLFDEAQAATVRAFKVCDYDPRVITSGFNLSQAAQYPSVMNPPSFSASVDTATAAPASSVGPDAITLQLEVCTDRCERWIDLVDGSLVRWTAHAGCMEELP